MREGVTYKRLGEVAPSQKYDGEITSVSGLYWLLNLDMVEPNTGNVIKKVMAAKEELDGSITSFSPDNVLYSKLRPYLNKVVLPDECGYCTTELVPLCPKKDLLSREYLAYFLRSNTFVEFINDKVAGAKMPRVKMSDFWNHPIPIPSLSTQELIVRELDSISSVISAKKQQVLELDNLAQAIFLDTFGDPISNTKGWEVARIDSLCENLDYMRKPVTASDREAGDIPYYGASGIVDYVKDYIFDGDYLLVSEDGANLLARVTPIAFPISGKTWVNNHAHILKFDEACTQRYVQSFLNSVDLSNIISGAVQPKLNQANLNSYKIPLPPLSLQQAFAEKVQAIEEQKRLINQSIAEFESLLAQRMEFHFA